MKQVKSIDVGGGIPTDYHSDNEKMRYSDYASLLQQRVPQIKGNFNNNNNNNNILYKFRGAHNCGWLSLPATAILPILG